MFLLSLKIFFRSRGTTTGLLFIFFAGIIALFIGKQHLVKLEDSIHKTATFQHEHIQRNVTFFSDEMGLLLYYLRFGLINEPNRLNGLSIGQRDINPSIQSITIRNLENQKYDTDLNNPASLQAGNLDLGFVLIYLFPLIIIAFNYNILSEEKEAGTWSLVSVQAKAPMNLLLQKFIIRGSAVFTVFMLLFLAALVILPLPVNAALGYYMSVSFLYLLGWFCLCFWMVTWQRHSNVNALSMLTTWVLFTILLPAALNNYIINKYPVPEALNTVTAQREGSHTKWDMEEKVTMDKFYAHYPEYQKYTMPADKSSWLWYYAMQQMGDDEAREQAGELKDKLWKRIKVSRALAMFIPTLHTQLTLDEVTQSGLDNHLRFLDSTGRFHEKLRLYFYPQIFERKPVKNEDWSKFTVEHYTEENQMKWLEMFQPFAFVIMILLLWGLLNLKRHARRNSA